MSTNPNPALAELYVNLNDARTQQLLNEHEMKSMDLPCEKKRTYADDMRDLMSKDTLDMNGRVQDKVLYIDARGTPMSPPSSLLMKSRIYYVLMALRGAKLSILSAPERETREILDYNVFLITGRADVDFFRNRFTPKKFAIKIVQFCETIQMYARCLVTTYMGTGSLNPAHPERHLRITDLHHFGHLGLRLPPFFHYFNADLNLTERNYDERNNWTIETATERYLALFHYFSKNSPLQPVSLPAIG
jgi:hypothetical protein